MLASMNVNSLYLHKQMQECINKYRDKSLGNIMEYNIIFEFNRTNPDIEY